MIIAWADEHNSKAHSARNLAAAGEAVAWKRCRRPHQSSLDTSTVMNEVRLQKQLRYKICPLDSLSHGLWLLHLFRGEDRGLTEIRQSVSHKIEDGVRFQQNPDAMIWSILSCHSLEIFHPLSACQPATVRHGPAAGITTQLTRQIVQSILCSL
jgi:hypothetical protein